MSPDDEEQAFIDRLVEMWEQWEAEEPPKLEQPKQEVIRGLPDAHLLALLLELNPCLSNGSTGNTMRLRWDDVAVVEWHDENGRIRVCDRDGAEVLNLPPQNWWWDWEPAALFMALAQIGFTTPTGWTPPADCVRKQSRGGRK